jgi:NTE family protein
VLVREGKLDFQILCGVSVGAINAGYLAQAMHEEDETRSLSNLAIHMDRLMRFWLGIRDSKDLFRRRAGGLAGVSVGKNSLFDATPMRRLLEKEIDAGALCSSGRLLLVGVTSLETGRYHVVRNEASHRDRILAYLIASATTPLYFEPVEESPPEPGAKKQHLVDGGLMGMTPIDDAMAERPDEVFVLYTFPKEMPLRSYRENMFGTAVKAFDFLDRSVDLVADETHRAAMVRMRHSIHLKEQWERLKRRLPAEVRTLMELKELDEDFGRIHTAPVHEIAPTEILVSTEALDFSPEKIRAAYEHGKERARAKLVEIACTGKRAGAYAKTVGL